MKVGHMGDILGLNQALRIHTKEDGSCLYYSIVLGNILLDEKHGSFEQRVERIKSLLDNYSGNSELFKAATTLRIETAKALERPDLNYLTGYDRDMKEKEVQRTKMGWGGEVQIKAMGGILKKRIYSYVKDGSNSYKLSRPYDSEKRWPILSILYVNDNHYDLLINLTSLDDAQKKIIINTFNPAARGNAARAPAARGNAARGNAARGNAARAPAAQAPAARGNAAQAPAAASTTRKNEKVARAAQAPAAQAPAAASATRKNEKVARAAQAPAAQAQAAASATRKNENVARAAQAQAAQAQAAQARKKSPAVNNKNPKNQRVVRFNNMVMERSVNGNVNYALINDNTASPPPRQNTRYVTLPQPGMTTIAVTIASSITCAFSSILAAM
jgi:hypothetical protein